MRNEETRNEETPSKQPVAERAERKAFASPELFEYGSVAKLTRSTGSTNGDAGQVMMP